MTHPRSATAIAPANIAFIKYWGMQDVAYTLPYNGSISMNLDACLTSTTVTFDPDLAEDALTLRLYAGPDSVAPPQRATGRALERVSAQLERLRRLAGVSWRARVESTNNFPSDAGIASSAAAFAALTLAGVAALGLDLPVAIAFNYPNIDALAGFLGEALNSAWNAASPEAPPPAEAT